MVILRCTDQLLYRLDRLDDAPRKRSTTRLGNWVGDLIDMGGRRILLFVSERSQLPILMPVAAADGLWKTFPDAVCNALAEVGVAADAIERERAAMGDIFCCQITARSHREMVRTWAVFTRTTLMMQGYRKSLDDLARSLVKTRVDDHDPVAATRELFERRANSLTEP